MILVHLFAKLMLVFIRVVSFNALSFSDSEAHLFIVHNFTKKRPVFLLLSLMTIAHVLLI